MRRRLHLRLGDLKRAEKRLADVHHAALRGEPEALLLRALVLAARGATADAEAALREAFVAGLSPASLDADPDAAPLRTGDTYRRWRAEPDPKPLC